MHLLILGGSRSGRIEAAAADWLFGRDLTVALDAARLPFAGPGRLTPDTGSGALAGSLERPRRLFLLRDIHRAFPNKQMLGTRLILTQSTYVLQKLLDELDDGDRVLATAERDALEANAPEAFYGRGPWRQFEIAADADDAGLRAKAEAGETPGPETRDPTTDFLVRAYETGAAEERLRLCREAARDAPESPVALLALASAWRENQGIDAARHALDRALDLAPDWEAAHYEDGKFWLAQDDMERARDGFRRAGELMPTFSAAFGNLGATLGELGEPEAALAAFTTALTTDPQSFTVLNNIGVVNRELGRLEEAEAASRRVIELAPDFVFGYYNLGHTLFLAGRFAEALAAYEEGQRRDPEKNRRQGCRLAVVRLAGGDVHGAERDLWHFADSALPDERQDLLLEAYETAYALLTTRPELGRHQAFLDRIAAAITR